jgi:choline-sulfatase
VGVAVPDPVEPAGEFLDVLEQRGERNDTLVVFASDHSEMLGDHGFWYKQRPYQTSAGVPFVVSGPGVTDRGVVDIPATILDLHATVLDYAGLDPVASIRRCTVGLCLLSSPAMCTRTSPSPRAALATSCFRGMDPGSSYLTANTS